VREKIFEIVKTSISNLNEELCYESLNDVSDATPIYGGAEGIDSLSLVMLVSEVEGEVNDEFDASVLLASEKAMSMKNSPYNSVGAFVAFIEAELKADAS
jgi:acyl carrier protein